MARAFTAKTIENLKPDATRRELPDPALSGLYVVVQPSGARSWALRYRHKGKTRKMTLGRWPVMSVANARMAATEALQVVELGGDPAAEKQAAKKSNKPDRDTVAALIAAYDKRHLSKLRSGHEVKRTLDSHVVSRWRDRQMQDITRRDVRDLLDEIVDTGKITTANRVRAYLSGLFNWCLERDVIDASPLAGIKPIKERPRDRLLSDDEIRWFWKACGEIGEPWGPMGKMLLLTGQRLNEVAQMTEGEIDGDVWHLSADRTKNSRPHDVPLSQVTSAVMQAKERVKGPNSYIFTTNGTAPVQGFFKAKTALGDIMVAVAEKERGEAVEIPRWTFHDLRRTTATGMARLGIPVRVTEAVLNHVSGTGAGIVAVYQRHDYAEEKRAALEAWAQFVTQLIERRVGRVDSDVRSEALK